MPFWRPDPFTSVMESEGNPSSRSSERMGSNASCRMYATTIFMRAPPGAWPGSLARQRLGREVRRVADELGRRDELLRVPVHAVLGDVETGVLLILADAEAVD